MDARKAINLLDLWTKIKNNETLSLIDFPSLVPMRWQYIKDNWKELKSVMEQRIASMSEDDTGRKTRLVEQLADMDDLINLKQKNRG